MRALFLQTHVKQRVITTDSTQVTMGIMKTRRLLLELQSLDRVNYLFHENGKWLSFDLSQSNQVGAHFKTSQLSLKKLKRMFQDRPPIPSSDLCP